MAGMLLYSILFCFLAIATVLYITRGRWLQNLPWFWYVRLQSTFASDMEEGFTSEHFDLEDNLTSGDPRAGLDQEAKREVQKLMKAKKVGFDEARRIYIEGKFAKNNIGADGRPRDPKFVSFS